MGLQEMLPGPLVHSGLHPPCARYHQPRHGAVGLASEGNRIAFGRAVVAALAAHAGTTSAQAVSHRVETRQWLADIGQRDVFDIGAGDPVPIHRCLPWNRNHYEGRGLEHASRNSRHRQQLLRKPVHHAADPDCLCDAGFYRAHLFAAHCTEAWVEHLFLLHHPLRLHCLDELGHRSVGGGCSGKCACGQGAGEDGPPREAQGPDAPPVASLR
mmetsp:Transcript_44570/g.103851  ORF Transcript_44570/g.103851 Transcript_44570/m.103851 type:complete len:213 (+) Transcript_44570:740-1378(+)